MTLEPADLVSATQGDSARSEAEVELPTPSQPARMSKAIADRIMALFALILLAPAFLLIAVLIKLTSPGPVFFRQTRAGLRGRAFSIVKFRTMVEEAESVGMGLMTNRDDPRVTRVGRILRQFSLDELPQLINIVIGDMSLIGPRPTLPYQVERYTSRQRGRLLMRPGITGWAQIHGRKRLSWPERIEYDLWYVQNWSLLLDLQIMVRTIPIALRAEDIDDAGVGDEISWID